MRVVRSLLLLAAAVAVPALSAPGTLSAQTYPSNKDPRSELDTVRGLTFINSDVAFAKNYIYQANFAGFTIWDITDPAKPVMASVTKCITSQGDPTIYGSLLFLSAEGAGNRKDCGAGGGKDPKDHMAGIRIFDVSNPKAPKLVKNVETCKGSHTHTLVPSPTNKNIIYLYVSGQQGARPDTELAGCKNGNDPKDPTNSLYQLDIVKVYLNAPEKSEVISGARIFADLEGAGECQRYCVPTRTGARAGRQQPAADMPAGPRNCHDVTAYPEMNMLLASCSTHSILVDIKNPEKPFRINAIMDTNNFQGRHTAAFSNDAKKLIQTEEWGGGTGPMCQASSMQQLGGNTIITLDAEKRQKQRAYFKLGSAQAAEENCVAHNGGILPVRGRDLYVQGWYQGGVNIMDFTNADSAFEIAYFDRGSINPPRPVDVPSAAAADPTVRGGGNTIGGSWGAYYWNGLIVSSELDRGLDILELTPTAQLSANEIAAAKLVTFEQFNPQSQPKYVWPPAFVVVRSYLDQLVRGQGLSAARTSAIDAALNALTAEVGKDIAGAKDPARVRAMAGEIRRLAAASK